MQLGKNIIEKTPIFVPSQQNNSAWDSLRISMHTTFIKGALMKWEEWLQKNTNFLPGKRH